MKKINIVRLGFLILNLFSLTPFDGFCQLKTYPQKDWQHLDPVLDATFGISTNRAYGATLKDHTSKTIIVAIIDSGIDTLHEDLKPVLWCNFNEKGRDEDHNGYINDRYGWNFLGAKKGNIAIKPGFEYFRVYLSLKDRYAKYSDMDIMLSGDKSSKAWLSAKKKFLQDSTATVSRNLAFWKEVAQEDSSWRKTLSKDTYTIKDLKFSLKDQKSINHNQFMLSLLAIDSTRTNQQQLAMIAEAKAKLFKKYSQDPIIHRIETIGDNYNNIQDIFYGDPDVSTISDHGTHVAGIIGAVRDNGIGVDGIADAVKLMTLKAVPHGADEYDKDIALAIRYAVDNGAKVVNMSFGKPYSPQQKWVEKALQYASKKDVLIVASAGNNASNIDSVLHYPTSRFLNGKYAKNMITVGASGLKQQDLIGWFSNYGKATVDVFAPGVGIYSTVNGNQYRSLNGTSMAAPIVAGLAALLRSYFPRLTAVQVKDIIERSVTKINFPVAMPGKKGKMVPMTELCRSGGIVNAYNAVMLAEKMSKDKK